MLPVLYSCISYMYNRTSCINYKEVSSQLCVYTLYGALYPDSINTVLLLPVASIVVLDL